MIIVWKAFGKTGVSVELVMNKDKVSGPSGTAAYGSYIRVSKLLGIAYKIRKEARK